MSFSYLGLFLLVNYACAFDFDDEMMSKDFTESEFSGRLLSFNNISVI